MKTCRKCSKSLALDQFYLSRGKPMAACKGCHKKMTRSWALKNPQKMAEISKKWDSSNRPKRNATAVLYRIKIRREIISHYSDGMNVCSCCGEDHFEFLCIDHIDGGGNRHRRESKITSGHQMIAWLKRNNLPSGFRVLCHNCNASIGFWGYCPHQPNGRRALLPDYSDRKRID